MTNVLFDALFARHAENTRPFLVRRDAPDLSYADFVKAAAQMAHVLTAHGVQPGDRIVVQADKSVEMVLLYAATVQAGGVFLPLNTAYTQDEVRYFAADATPRLIVCSSSKAESLRPVADTVSAKVLTLDADGSGSLTEDMAARPTTFATVPRGPDDLAGLLYTSGTTGRSKGAMMSHRNLLSNAESLIDLWRIADTDRLIHALPIFHTHGLFVALNTALLAGAEVCFLPGFDLDAIFDEMPRATLMMGVPTFYTRMLGDPRLTRDRARNMRLFISGSAPLLAETHEAFTARTGHRILERYGMTETNMITSNPYEGDRRPGAVGHALPGVEVKITDPETGAPLPPGEIGMIEVRGPNVFQGYWQMPEKTAEELRADGFFITGDLATMSVDGYVTIVGRAKDLIITGGYNVYPKEVEDVLNDLDGVQESAVFGVPHADFGEAILAAVVPEPGAALDSTALETAVAARLARFKHPRRFIEMSSLPRNAMGKVQKNVLRNTYAG